MGLVLAAAIAGTASVAAAATQRIERGAETITPGTQNGEEGYWVEFEEYTYEEALAVFNDLAAGLSDADRKAAEAEFKKLKSPTLDELKKLIEKYSVGPLRDLYKSIFGTTPDASSLNALKKKIADGKLTLAQVKTYLTELKGLIDLGATPAYGGGRTLYVSSLDKVLGVTSWGPAWRNKKSWLGVTNVKTTTTSYRRYYNTGSSMVEASRLARMIELLDMGLVDPGVTWSGGHYALGRWQKYGPLDVSRAVILDRLQRVYKLGIDTSSPIALDLNHDGKIGVTGKSTAAIRNPGNDFVKDGSVMFDLRGLGRKERIEWLNAQGDGFLVLDVDGAFTKAAAAGKDVDGHSLFGNVRGYDHGFEKLALHTAGIRMASVDPRLDQKTVEAVLSRKAATGNDLAPLKVWIDSNGDAKAQVGELRTLASLGITEVGLQPEFQTNAQGEMIIVSYYVQDGKRYMTEDVWFAVEPAGKAR